jgi:serine phosphatase RsbU (regulator of sigma subunit)/anti-sigma regulatory factor (Ser/Thr protein kinase)
MNSQAILSMPASVVRYSIPADVSLVASLRKRFIETITSSALEESEVHRWELVFQELTVNAICHGAAEDPSKVITIEWSVSQDAITIGAQDPGSGPPDSLLENPPLPDPESLSGRGLFIISQFADNLHWWRGTAGFRLEVVKHYPALGLTLPGNPELDSVLDELSSCYESLSVFHRLTENLIESGNLRDFIDRSLNEFISLHPHDRIFIQGSTTIPESIRATLSPASWFLDPNDADHTLKTLGSFARETVWENNEDLARQHPATPPLRTLGAGCVFPIVAGDIHFGALIVLRKPTAPETRFRSLGTLRTLADLCGIACANAHLTGIRDATQRELREFEIAVEIQKSLLPIIPPPVSPRWSVSIHQESALTIAGDYAIARNDGAGNLAIAMIDVMGKGVSAALLASIFRTAFEMSLHIPTASGMLETINRTLCNQLGDLTMFITCAIARIPANGSSLDHSSAGHCPTFLYDHTGTRTFLRPSGPPLGILSDTRYTGETITLLGGERAVFVTDGCYEWDRSGRQSGWDEFVALIDSNRSTPATDLWNSIRDRIRKNHGAALDDDCTLITLDITP